MAVETVKNATFHNNKGDLFTSFDVADFDVPQGRDEVWQFVPLRRLRGLHNGEYAEAVEPNVQVDLGEGNEQASAEVLDASDARVRRLGGAVDRVGAQAYTEAKRARYIHVARDAQLERPITVLVTGQGDGKTSFGNLVVDVESGAKATVIVRYVGSGTHADNIEISVGDNAHLTFVVDAAWNNDAVHVSGHVAQLGRDAVLRHSSAVFGGEVVRIVPRVKFTEPGADAELLGVYFADDGQFFEQRLLVDHAVPQCRSNVLYKGALQGDKHSDKPDARTAWVGDVLIRANAQGTDTYEANRNLVLTEGARADAVPNLEIETGEIAGAGHAATVGRFDDEQEFYLRARGIPPEEARRLIIRGFFLEVINKIPVASVREDLEHRVAHELGV